MSRPPILIKLNFNNKKRKRKKEKRNMQIWLAIGDMVSIFSPVEAGMEWETVHVVCYKKELIISTPIL